MSFFSLYIINNNGSRNIKNVSEKLKWKKCRSYTLSSAKKATSSSALTKKSWFSWMGALACTHTHISNTNGYYTVAYFLTKILVDVWNLNAHPLWKKKIISYFELFKPVLILLFAIYFLNLIFFLIVSLDRPHRVFSSGICIIIIIAFALRTEKYQCQKTKRV